MTDKTDIAVGNAVESPTALRTKVTLSVPVRFWNEVGRLAREEGVTRTELLRRGVSLESLRWNLQKVGSKLGVVTADGKMEQIHFPF